MYHLETNLQMHLANLQPIVLDVAYKMHLHLQLLNKVFHHSKVQNTAKPQP